MFVLVYQGTRFPVRPEMVLGRSPYCSLVLPSASVSRRHAALRLTSDGVEVEDLGSYNGTLLNGGRIEGVARAQHGDELKLGDCRLTLIDTACLPEGNNARSTARLEHPFRALTHSSEDPSHDTLTQPVALSTSLELLEALLEQAQLSGSLAGQEAARRAAEHLGLRCANTPLAPRLVSVVQAIAALDPSDETRAWATGLLEGIAAEGDTRRVSEPGAG